MRDYVYIVYHGMIPVYVGKGHGSRYLSHFSTAGGGSTRKLAYFQEHKFELRSIIVSALMERRAAHSYERVLIRMIGREDLGLGPLLNATDGGEGVVGVSPEARARISSRVKAQWSDPIAGTKIRETARKALADPIIQARRRTSTLLIEFTDEVRLKMRSAWTPERRAAQAARIAKYNKTNKPMPINFTPAVRAKMRAVWTPERRAAQAAKFKQP